MKRRSQPRRKLQLTRTTIRQLSSRRLANARGGGETFVSIPDPQQQGAGGGEESQTAAECILSYNLDCGSLIC